MITLAALQMKSVCGDVAANLARIGEAAIEAAGKGASLLITPELGLTGYGAGDAIGELAETADGPLVKRLQAISAETGVAMIAGFAERAGPRSSTALFMSMARQSPSSTANPIFTATMSARCSPRPLRARRCSRIAASNAAC